jgi:hypothetical protein
LFKRQRATKLLFRLPRSRCRHVPRHQRTKHLRVQKQFRVFQGQEFPG